MGEVIDILLFAQQRCDKLRAISFCQHRRGDILKYWQESRRVKGLEIHYTHMRNVYLNYYYSGILVDIPPCIEEYVS